MKKNIGMLLTFLLTASLISCGNSQNSVSENKETNEVKEVVTEAATEIQEEKSVFDDFTDYETDAYAKLLLLKKSLLDPDSMTIRDAGFVDAIPFGNSDEERKDGILWVVITAKNKMGGISDQKYYFTEIGWYEHCTQYFANYIESPSLYGHVDIDKLNKALSME